MPNSPNASRNAALSRAVASAKAVGATYRTAAQNKLRNSTAVRYTGRPTVKANGTGQYGATPAVPAAGPGNMNDINAYLGGDSGYQDQLRQLSKALGDFQADVGRRRGTLDTEYGVSQQALQLLLQEQGQYESQNSLEQQRAREEAIRRRAEQYGI